MISYYIADELEFERAKKEQAECKKRVAEATRVLGREGPNLTQAKQKLENFLKTFQFVGLSLEDIEPSASSSAGDSFGGPQLSRGTASTHSSLLQMNDDCLMPSYESKAIIQKTPKKILQGGNILLKYILGNILLKKYIINKNVKEIYVKRLFPLSTTR